MQYLFDSWIFFIEGLATFVFGIFSAFFMPETAGSAKFLSAEERTAIAYILKDDWVADEDHEPFSWTEVIGTFKSPHVALMSIVFFMQGAFTVKFSLGSALTSCRRRNDPVRSCFLCAHDCQGSWLLHRPHSIDECSSLRMCLRRLVRTPL